MDELEEKYGNLGLGVNGKFNINDARGRMDELMNDEELKEALKNMKKAVKAKKAKAELEEKIQKFRDKVQKTFNKEIKERGCIGSIAEIYDSKRPQLPNGTIAQAWSVAEVFRIILGK